MPGKQYVMAGRETAENIVLNNIVRFILEKQVAFVS